MVEITCTVCPMGCHINVEQTLNGIILSGQGCHRGELYVRDEAVAPKRILTGVVRVFDSMKVLSVKTASAIPKEKIFEAMTEMQELEVQGPIKIGQVLIPDLAGTGISLVATKNIS